MYYLGRKKHNSFDGFVVLYFSVALELPLYFSMNKL